MCIVSNKDGMRYTKSDMARELSITLSYAIKLTQTMHKFGLIEEKRDGRAVYLEPTKTGKLIGESNLEGKKLLIKRASEA